jgi:hypothetical protein
MHPSSKIHRLARDLLREFTADDKEPASIAIRRLPGGKLEFEVRVPDPELSQPRAARVEQLQRQAGRSGCEADILAALTELGFRVGINALLRALQERNTPWSDSAVRQHLRSLELKGLVNHHETGRAKGWGLTAWDRPEPAAGPAEA